MATAGDRQRLPALLRVVLSVGTASSSARLHLVERCRAIAWSAARPAGRRWPARCWQWSIRLHLVELLHLALPAWPATQQGCTWSSAAGSLPGMRCARLAGAGRRSAGDGRSAAPARAGDHRRRSPAAARVAARSSAPGRALSGHWRACGAPGGPVLAGDLPVMGDPRCTWSCWRAWQRLTSSRAAAGPLPGLRQVRRAGAGRRAACDGRSAADPLHLPELVATANDHQRLPALLHLVLTAGLASRSARLRLVEHCRAIARPAARPAGRCWSAICRRWSIPAAPGSAGGPGSGSQAVELLRGLVLLVLVLLAGAWPMNCATIETPRPAFG